MTRRLGYARTSTEDPELLQQLYVLESARCDSVFADRSALGAADFPQWNACLATLQKGDVLVVTGLDRIARSLKDLVTALLRLAHLKVEFEVCSWATQLAPGKLAELLQRVIEFETAVNREQVRVGRSAARAEGRKEGRPFKLNTEQMKELQAMKARPNIDVMEIANHFGVSRSTAYMYLRRLPSSR